MRSHLIKPRMLVLFSLVLMISFADHAAGQASDDRNRNGPVFKTTDGGASWKPINTGFVARFVLALAIDPVNPEIIYAGSDRGVFKSTDGGNNWIVPDGNITLSSIQAIAIDPVTPLTIYAATSSGIYKSTDGAATWSRINNGLQSKGISRLIINPVNPSILYLSTIDRIFKSQNGGGNWEEVLKLPPTGDGLFPADLILDPRNPLTIYTIGSNRVFRSTDGGQNWNEIFGQAGLGLLIGIVVDPVNSTLYLIDHNLVVGLFKSTDGGSTWTRLTLNIGAVPPFGVSKMAIDPVSASTFYWATSQGVVKSTDGGSNWVETGFSPSKGFPTIIYTLAINPINTSTVYASTNGIVSPNDSPWINNVFLSGKHLLVFGDSFDDGATILLDGDPQKTINESQMPTRLLVSKKAGKKVKKNPESRIQIRNSNGKLSQTVVRPVD